MREVDKMLLPSWPLGSFAESLFLETRPCARAAVSYYNDTQHRNHDDLGFLGDAAALRVADLMAGEAAEVPVAPGGRVPFRIREPGNYRFLRYELPDTIAAR